MTYSGGANDYGTIFEWNPTTNAYTTKISFTGTSGLYLGQNPYGSLTLGTNGKFYGMTSIGGTGYGNIFEWDPSDNTFTNKISFTRNTGLYLGSRPFGSLVQASNGKFYGMASANGGSGKSGVIFEWDPVTNIYTKKIAFNDFLNGNPYGSLSLASNGKFYGMESSESVGGNGSIFEWNPTTNAYTTKISFIGTSGLYLGSRPYGSLTLNANGKFYGMTKNGGSGTSYGNIFEWDPSDNTFTNKINFASIGLGSPYGDLTLGPNGKYYGMTYGSNCDQTGPGGVIFEWNPTDNSFSNKVTFTTDTRTSYGCKPIGSVALSGGKLYGMTSIGGATNDNGVIFEFDPTDNLAPVASAVSFSGTLRIGQLLTGIYTYTDADSDPQGTSTFRWLRDGSAIGSATSLTYTTVLADVGHAITFEVTPVASSGTTPGVAVVSAGQTILNSAPTASSLSVTGTLKVNQTLTSNYTYGDLDGDLTGTPTYRWFRDAVVIPDATSSTYTTLVADVGKTITFEVTPIALTGTTTGTGVVSSGYVIGNTAPTASSVTISGSNNVNQTLTGNYTFTDVDGDIQGTSLYKWYRNDVAIDGATSINYTLTTTDSEKNISFEITPVSQTGTTNGTEVKSSGMAINKYIAPHGYYRPPVITTTPPVITPHFTFTKTLKLGMTNSDVKQLQMFLNTHNFPISTTGSGSLSNETNFFGALTKKALIKFQLANKLKGDGVAGPLTFGVMNGMQ